MKTFKKLAGLFLITLFIASCNTNDDGFYNTEYVTIPGLVTIEELDIPYNVNDYIYINSNFERLQSQANQSTLLDLRKSTGNAPSFSFTFQLEKKVGNDWQFITPTASEVDIQKGQMVYGGFFSANSVFSSIDDEYQFRAGIKLTSAGQYRISFGYNSSSSAVELRSDSTGNNIFLNITSSSTNSLDSNGYYNFTVN
ncbi:hypothetical protein [Flavobacterium sp.]|uniref:hypothetical protein n=1 Tax=Flavobacterium sp. TaxID=239 RepID=UPI003751D1F6